MAPREMLAMVHVAAGLVGLVVMPLVMAMHKGGRNHRRWGWVTFWALMVVCATAFGLLAYRPNPFLLGVTVLAGYSALAGLRVLRRKRPGGRAGGLDVAAAGMALATGGLLLALAAGAASGRLPGLPAELGPPALVFGLVLALGARGDLAALRRPPTEPAWCRVRDWRGGGQSR